MSEPTAVPTLTTPPPAPQRSSDPDTFVARADARIRWQDINVQEMASVIDWQNAVFVATGEAVDQAQTAAQSASEDAQQTASDRAATVPAAQDAVAAAQQTASDRQQTGEDRAATSQDRQLAQEAREQAQAIAAGNVAVTDLQPGVWQPISSSTTLAANNWYAVDFTSAPLTLTLPANPSTNDMVRFYKSAGAAEGSIISRNGQTIMGAAEDMTINTEITALDLVYNGADWRVLR